MSNCRSSSSSAVHPPPESEHIHTCQVVNATIHVYCTHDMPHSRCTYLRRLGTVAAAICLSSISVWTSTCCLSSSPDRYPSVDRVWAPSQHVTLFSVAYIYINKYYISQHIVAVSSLDLLRSASSSRRNRVRALTGAALHGSNWS